MYECPPTAEGPSCLPRHVDCLFPSTHSGSLHSHRPSFPPLQPLTGLPLASHFLSTLALNSHSGLQYTDKLFPPKRTHYLQGKKQGMMSLWRKCLPRTEDPRWKEWEHTLPPPPPFVPVDLTWPKRSQEIKYLCPGPYPGQPSFSHITLPYYFPIPSGCLQRIAFEVNHTFGFRTSNKTYNSVFKDHAFQFLFNSDSFLWDMAIRKMDDTDLVSVPSGFYDKASYLKFLSFSFLLC